MQAVVCCSIIAMVTVLAWLAVRLANRPENRARWKLVLRIAIGSHLVANCVCTLGSLLDGGVLRATQQAQTTLEMVFGFLLIPAMFAWVICPVVVLAVAISRKPCWPTVLGILAELFLCVMQIMATLPMVQ